MEASIFLLLSKARSTVRPCPPSTKMRSDKISSSDKLVIVLAFYSLDKIQVHTNTVICIMVGQYYPAIIVVCQINCQTQIWKEEQYISVLYCTLSCKEVKVKFVLLSHLKLNWHTLWVFLTRHLLAGPVIAGINLQETWSKRSFVQASAVLW